MSEQRFLFLCLGRRGALPRLVFEAAKALRDMPSVQAHFYLAEGMEREGEIRETGADVRFVPTFSNALGAVAGALHLGPLKRRLREDIAEFQPDAVIELMPHVWSPLLEDVFRKAGVPRVALVHDAAGHPGDGYGVVNDWLLTSALRADRVVALSQFVADEIVARTPAGRVSVLLHPDFTYTPSTQRKRTDAPLRVLFLGRLLAYKGLDLAIEAIELACAAGAQVELAVHGDGDVSMLRDRLQRAGARVVNTWLDDDAIASALSAADVLLASYREASQSGVVAAALGAGLPVIATPVGALPEQVKNGRYGLIAADTSPAAIASCLVDMASNRDRLASFSSAIIKDAPSRSTASFLEALFAARCAA